MWRIHLLHHFSTVVIFPSNYRISQEYLDLFIDLIRELRTCPKGIQSQTLVGMPNFVVLVRLAELSWLVGLFHLVVVGLLCGFVVGSYVHWRSAFVIHSFLRSLVWRSCIFLFEFEGTAIVLQIQILFLIIRLTVLYGLSIPLLLPGKGWKLSISTKLLCNAIFLLWSRFLSIIMSNISLVGLLLSLNALDKPMTRHNVVYLLIRLLINGLQIWSHWLLLIITQSRVQDSLFFTAFRRRYVGKNSLKFVFPLLRGQIIHLDLANIERLCCGYALRSLINCDSKL